MYPYWGGYERKEDNFMHPNPALSVFGTPGKWSQGTRRQTEIINDTMVRLKAKEHKLAAYFAVPGPKAPHTLAKTLPHLGSCPDVYLPNGCTLVQPRLPPLLEHPWFAGHTPVDPGDLHDVYDDRDMVAPESTPPPDPTWHRWKRAARWRH
ncbi:hypothetical protein DFH09DRAFT_1085515 [Mycena vulgaris]|nr:hypothetical protein DFH09DRAFT_1085515 [Mycena vulgaris]